MSRLEIDISSPCFRCPSGTAGPDTLRPLPRLKAPLLVHALPFHSSDPSLLQALYIDTDAELLRWVGTDPEYSAEALTALADAIVDTRGLLKAKRAVLLQ